MNPIVEALNLGKMLRGSKPSNSSVLAGAIETGRQEVAAAVAAQAKASEAYTASLLSPDPRETQARHAENVAAGIEIERRRYRLADVERKYAEATRREREADAKARSLQLQRDLAVFAEDAGERYNAACETLVGIAVEMARLRERVTEVNGDAPAGCRLPDPEWLARGASDGEAVTLRETTFSAWVFTKAGNPVRAADVERIVPVEGDPTRGRLGLSNVVPMRQNVPHDVELVEFLEVEGEVEVRIARLTERLALPGWRPNDRPYWLPTPDASPANVLRRVADREARPSDTAPPKAPERRASVRALDGRSLTFDPSTLVRLNAKALNVRG